MSHDDISAITVPLAFVLVLCSGIWAVYLNNVSDNAVELKYIEQGYCKESYKHWVKCEDLKEKD